MLYHLRHALAVNVESVFGLVEVGDYLFWLVIFFGLILPLKLQIELSEIHRSRNGASYSRYSLKRRELLEPTRSETCCAWRLSTRHAVHANRLRTVNLLFVEVNHLGLTVFLIRYGCNFIYAGILVLTSLHVTSRTNQRSINC